MPIREHILRVSDTQGEGHASASLCEQFVCCNGRWPLSLHMPALAYEGAGYFGLRRSHSVLLGTVWPLCLPVSIFYTTFYLTCVVRPSVGKIFSDRHKILPLGVVFCVGRWTEGEGEGGNGREGRWKFLRFVEMDFKLFGVRTILTLFIWLVCICIHSFIF